MSNIPRNPDFPPQRFTAAYELGFETDRELLVGIDEEAWDFTYDAAETFILCNPYLNPDGNGPMWEVEESGGARFLVTTDVPFLDAPPLVIYFKADDETRRVAFLTVEPAPETPEYPPES